jgi:hypothetical protein
MTEAESYTQARGAAKLFCVEQLERLCCGDVHAFKTKVQYCVVYRRESIRAYFITNFVALPFASIALNLVLFELSQKRLLEQ